VIAIDGSSRDEDLLAALYDWEHDEFADDVDFFVALARRTGGPALELACGSGRLLAAIAGMGLNIVGLDLSSQMLGRARCRLRDAGVSARLDQGDMIRGLPDGTFALVILGLDAFGFVREREAQLRLLRDVRARLARGGIVALDLIHLPALLDPPNGAVVLQRSGWCDELDAEVAKWVVRDVAFGSQELALTCLYDVAARAGTFRRLTERLRLRFFSPGEIELLLERAGLAVEAVYGDYDAGPLRDDSDRMIVLAGDSSGTGV